MMTELLSGQINKINLYNIFVAAVSNNNHIEFKPPKPAITKVLQVHVRLLFFGVS